MKINSSQQINLMKEKTEIQENKKQKQNFKQKLAQLQQSQQTKAERKEELKETTRKFSTIFVNLMLKEMRNTVPEGGYLDGGLKEDIFREKLDQQYAKEIADSGQLSLADKLYNQLSQKID